MKKSANQPNSTNLTNSKNPDLDKDGRELQNALSKLVRAYQFRDRNRIYYYDVSVTQCYAISVLCSHKSMTAKELAAKLYLDKSTTSRVVNSLKQKGYIQRTLDPNDGRARILEVTEKGRELHARIEQDLVNEMKKLLEDFDPDVRHATIRLFSKLAQAVTIRFSKNEPLPPVEK